MLNCCRIWSRIEVISCKSGVKSIEYKKYSKIRKEGKNMNFNDKKTKRIIAVVIMVVIVAMVATTIIPYLMG